MVIKKRDFQKVLNLVKEFQAKLPCNETSAELRDSLNHSLLHMHKYYKKVRIRCQNGSHALDKSISLTSSLTGGTSPVSPFIAPLDKFGWRWLSLDVNKLSASFGHGDKTNYLPEIFYAVKDCDLEKLKEMIEKDEEQVNELDAIGRTTAMYAIQGGTEQYLECLNLLISHGVDLQHQGNDGFSCLHMACFYGYKEIVEILLREKVEVNAKDSDGRTPLHWASAYCSSDILELLIIHGADVNVQDNEGTSAAMMACHFDQLENLQLILASQKNSRSDSETPFQVYDSNGANILHWAVSKTSNIDCLKFLKDAENANLCDDEGRSIFLHAAEHGCLLGCEEILNSCPDAMIEDVDIHGRSALHLATLGGHGEVVDFLLNRGADQDYCDNQGATPLDYAISRKLHYCAMVFISYQKYKERLQNMKEKLESHDNRLKKAEGQKDYQDEDQKMEIINRNENKKNLLKLNDADQKEKMLVDEVERSVKLDVQDAVGFEIDGDIDEEAEEDIEFEYEGDYEEEEKEDQDRNEDESPDGRSEVIDRGNGLLKKVGEKTQEDKEKRKEGKHNNQKIHTNDGSKDSKKEEKITNVTFGKEDPPIKQSKLKDESEINTKADEEIADQKKDETEERNISIEESVDFEEEMIVLVAHHGSDDDMVIEYGNDADKQEDSETSKPFIQSDVLNVNDAGKLDAVEDRDLYETSRLSPRIESVTGLMETNTMPANYSASVNMSVSSLGSDSEDDEGKDYHGDVKKEMKGAAHLFEEHSVNQIEYRNPFPKQRLHRQTNTRTNHPPPAEEDRPASTHGKRKEKKGNKKDRKSPPKAKLESGIPQSISRIGPLEPMKPLQPLMAPQGFSPNRNAFGGVPHLGSLSPKPQELSLPPSSPRSGGLSSPGESPRLPKTNPLSSPRFGLDGRDSAMSNIPRPHSPRAKEDHGMIGGHSLFPKPPMGR